MRRWSHGHSLGTGALLALSLSYRPWLLLAAGFALGVGATLAWRFGRKVGQAVGRSVASYATTRLKAEVRERRQARRLARLPEGEEIPF